MLLEKLKKLECSLHGKKRNDREWLEKILHKECVEITRSGVLVERAEIIEALSGEKDIPSILSSDFNLLSVRDNFAILYYRTTNADGSRASLRSSCWECSGNGEWKLVFHQGTPDSQDSQA